MRRVFRFCVWMTSWYTALHYTDITGVYYYDYCDDDNESASHRRCCTYDIPTTITLTGRNIGVTRFFLLFRFLWPKYFFLLEKSMRFSTSFCHNFFFSLISLDSRTHHRRRVEETHFNCKHWQGLIKTHNTSLISQKFLFCFLVVATGAFIQLNSACSNSTCCRNWFHAKTLLSATVHNSE